MVFTRKEKQSSTGLLSHLDDSIQGVLIGNAMNITQEKTTVNEGTSDHKFTVCKSDASQTVNEIVVYMKTLERCFNEGIERELGNINNTVESRL